MTTCDSIRPLLSAFIDAELPVEEANAVRNHLEECSICRTEWESLTAVDAQLSRALRIPESIIARCNEVTHHSRSGSPLQAADGGGGTESFTAEQHVGFGRRAARPNTLRIWGGVGVLAAMAATILILVRTRTQEGPPAGAPAIVARLVRATGPVQLLAPGAEDWASVPPESRETIPVGWRVRTGERVLCEIKTVAQGTIRLNELAEVSLQQPDRLKLLSGQLWCRSPSDATISIDVDISEAQAAVPQIATMACPNSSEIECVAGGGFAACGSISPTNADTTFSIGNYSCTVTPGETVSINSQRDITRSTNLGSPNKIWQLPLLAVSDNGDDELLASISSLLAPIGMTKAIHLNEEQLRALGPTGSLPLLIYAASETASEHLELRRKAIRLAGEHADERGLPLLRKLVADADPQIAQSASEILERLARQAQ